MMEKKNNEDMELCFAIHNKKMTTMGIEGPCPLQQENGDHRDGGKWNSLPFVTKR